ASRGGGPTAAWHEPDTMLNDTRSPLGRKSHVRGRTSGVARIGVTHSCDMIGRAGSGRLWPLSHECPAGKSSDKATGRGLTGASRGDTGARLLPLVLKPASRRPSCKARPGAHGADGIPRLPTRAGIKKDARRCARIAPEHPGRW